jgi:hypothetical protein
MFDRLPASLRVRLNLSLKVPPSLFYYCSYSCSDVTGQRPPCAVRLGTGRPHTTSCVSTALLTALYQRLSPADQAGEGRAVPEQPGGGCIS